MATLTDLRSAPAGARDALRTLDGPPSAVAAIADEVDSLLTGTYDQVDLFVAATQAVEAAADLEFEEAGRLRDEIRMLEQSELGIPVDQQKLPMMGRSNEGKPGTRKTRFGKTQRKFGR